MSKNKIKANNESIFNIDQKTFYLFLVTLCSLDFFSPIGITNLGRSIYFLFIVLAFPVFIVQLIKNNKLVFSFPLRILFIAILISFISAYFFWNQGILDSVVALLFSIAGYIFYFYFNKKNFEIRNVEKVILWAGCLYMLIFFISFVIYPAKLFWNPYSNENSPFFGVDDRGFQRILLNGNGFLYLFFFFVLNKAYENRDAKWIVSCVVSYICILMTLTRAYILFSSLVALFYLFNNLKGIKKIILIILSLTIGLVIYELPFVQRLIEYTQNDADVAEDYVRLREFDYFLGDFQRSVFTKIFGNGFDRTNISGYGKMVGRLQDTDNFYIVDLGIIGLYIYLGILGIVAFISVIYVSMKIKLPKEFYYLKMFMIFLLTISFTSFAFYSLDFLMPIVFVLFLYDKVKKKAL